MRPDLSNRGTMSNISTYLADKLLDHYLDGTAYTAPTAYVGLYTTAPTMPAGTGGVEVSGGSYARVALTGLMGAASAGSKANSSAINFATASASWGTVTAVGIFDAVTAGNLLEAGPLTASKTVGSGDTFQLPIGDLTSALS
jgi:hypothetical protein